MKRKSSSLQHRWLGINYNHHGISHGSEGVTASMAQRTEWLDQIELWHAQQFMYLVQKMDAINDGDGSLLDHSAVIWMHEQANGGTHGRKDHPYVLAGSCRGAFNLGYRPTVVASATATRALPAAGDTVIPAAVMQQASLAALRDLFAVLVERAGDLR